MAFLMDNFMIAYFGAFVNYKSLKISVNSK